MGFSKTDTLTLLQTSCLVGSRAILSAISISSGRTIPKTVYTFFHSLWLAKLMKNSGPEPTHATDPLLMVEQTSNGISLNVILCVSSDPWIKANGGPYPPGACQSEQHFCDDDNDEDIRIVRFVNVKKALHFQCDSLLYPNGSLGSLHDETDIPHNVERPTAPAYKQQIRGHYQAKAAKPKIIKGSRPIRKRDPFH